MGIGVNIYFPNEHAEKIKQLEKGEISKICQNALLEYFNLREYSVEELESKIRELNYEKERIDKNIEILNKKLQIAKEKLAEKIKQEKEQKEKQHKKEKEKRDAIRDIFYEEIARNLTEEEIDEYFEGLKEKKWVSIFEFGRLKNIISGESNDKNKN